MSKKINDGLTLSQRFYRKNKDRCRQKTIEWRLKNPDKVRNQLRRYRSKSKNRIQHNLTNRKSKLKLQYSLSVGEYEQLKDNQKGKCKLCFKETKRLVLDHDHTTGRVRGFVCDSCNHALASFDRYGQAFVERIHQYLWDELLEN